MLDLFGEEIKEPAKRGGGESMFRVNGCSKFNPVIARIPTGGMRVNKERTVCARKARK